MVSVSSNEIGRVEHCILKLDRKGKNAKSDEITRHNTVMSKSTPEFARAHIAELVFDRVEREGAIAIFYRIAGQSLLKYLPLSKYEPQSQLKTLFTQTNTVLLNEWNGKATFEQAVHPQKVLHNWLSAGCWRQHRALPARDARSQSRYARLVHQRTRFPQSLATRPQA